MFKKEKKMTITNKNDKRSQKGRSMVEMLGVLAIIGVLSVGGISAYGVAMKKHKANELMAATMQEAVLISAQLATGKTNPSLSSFNNSLFTSASTVTGTDNFKIALKTVDSDICEKMKSMLGVSSMVHAISDNCGEMIFNKNLTPKAITQSGGNSGGTGSEGGNSGGNSGEGGTTDPCADFEPTVCRTACTNNNGTAEYTYAEEGTPCHENYDPSTCAGWGLCPEEYSKACDGEGVCIQCPSDENASGISKWATVASKLATGEETPVKGCSCVNPTWTWNGSYCSGNFTGGGT
jgi:Tfp pilus assembly protein PilE